MLLIYLCRRCRLPATGVPSTGPAAGLQRAAASPGLRCSSTAATAGGQWVLWLRQQRLHERMFGCCLLLLPARHVLLRVLQVPIIRTDRCLESCVASLLILFRRKGFYFSAVVVCAGVVNPCGSFVVKNTRKNCIMLIIGSLVW